MYGCKFNNKTNQKKGLFLQQEYVTRAQQLLELAVKHPPRKRRWWWRLTLADWWWEWWGNRKLTVVGMKSEKHTNSHDFMLSWGNCHRSLTLINKPAYLLDDIPFLSYSVTSWANTQVFALSTRSPVVEPAAYLTVSLYDIQSCDSFGTLILESTILPARSVPASHREQGRFQKTMCSPGPYRWCLQKCPCCWCWKHPGNLLRSRCLQLLVFDQFGTNSTNSGCPDPDSAAVTGPCKAAMLCPALTHHVSALPLPLLRDQKGQWKVMVLFPDSFGNSCSVGILHTLVWNQNSFFFLHSQNLDLPPVWIQTYMDVWFHPKAVWPSVPLYCPTGHLFDVCCACATALISGPLAEGPV